MYGSIHPWGDCPLWRPSRRAECKVWQNFASLPSYLAMYLADRDSVHSTSFSSPKYFLSVSLWIHLKPPKEYASYGPPRLLRTIEQAFAVEECIVWTRVTLGVVCQLKHVLVQSLQKSSREYFRYVFQYQISHLFLCIVTIQKQKLLRPRMPKKFSPHGWWWHGALQITACTSGKDAAVLHKSPFDPLFTRLLTVWTYE